jgi:uncharacterized repeat protein (TIGR01451 family)
MPGDEPPPAADQPAAEPVEPPAAGTAEKRPAEPAAADDSKNGGDVPPADPTDTQGARRPPPAPRKPADQPAKSRQSVALSVEAVAPETITLGKPMSYELIVRNTGSDPAEDVVVEESIPPGTELKSADPEAAEAAADGILTWRLATLPAGAERRIRLEVLPQKEGEFARSAVVRCLVRTGRSTRVTRPQLTLVKVGPRQAIVGETAAFLLKLSNPGSGPATNILLRDTLPAGLEHPAGSEIEYEIGTLAAGETRDVKLEVVARQAGEYVNKAEVVADDGLRATAEARLVVLEPMLALEHTGPGKRYLARMAKYTLTVSNPGSAAADHVVLTNELPAGLEFVEASDNGRHVADKNQVTWALAEIPAGGSKAVTMTLRAAKPGEQLNHAVAAAHGGLKAEADARTLVEGIPALLLEVVDTDDPVEVGAETTYEIRVLNQGSKPGTNIRLHVTLPPSLTPISAEGPATHRMRGQEVIFEPLRVLGPRADAAYYVRARGVKPANTHAAVKLESDQLEQPVHEEESTHVYADQ